MYDVYVMVIVIVGCFDDDWIIDFMGDFGVGDDVFV